MSHIFISYSRRDKKVVAQFVESLRKQDFIVWQDVSNLSAGQAWQQALLTAIEQAAVVIVFWSHLASLSPYVNQEVEHAVKHGKRIIPVWLDKNTPLLPELGEAHAVITPSFSASADQQIVSAILESAPRIQRQVTKFKTNLPMNAQKIKGTRHQVIGSREYMIVPLIKSAYSRVEVIAEASTIVSQATRVQLIIQCTGNVSYDIVLNAFKAILAEDEEFPEDTQPLVAVFVTGPTNPANDKEYKFTPNNVAQYSDLVDTTRKAINCIRENSIDRQVFQIFQRSLVEIAFLLGVQLERWISFQLYKWEGDTYGSIMSVAPRT